MKLLKYIFSLTCFFIVIVSVSCERDDICAEGTPTTPFLIVKFINDETQIETDIKTPVELQIRAVGLDSVLNIGTVRDSILIPLKTNNTSTEFEFTINADTMNDMIPANTDIVNFQYTPVEEYVSSACGFRVIYNAITTNVTNEEEEGGNWIKGISVQRTNVTDEATAHIFIFH